MEQTFVPDDTPDPSADAAVEEGQVVRYLRLQRTYGSDHMNESLLEAYNNQSHTSAYLDTLV